MAERITTTSRLRDAISSGRTGDKVAFEDPAASPLGTDDEAAGTPPSAEAVAQAARQEGAAGRRLRARGQRRAGANHLRRPAERLAHGLGLRPLADRGGKPASHRRRLRGGCRALTAVDLASLRRRRLCTRARPRCRRVLGCRRMVTVVEEGSAQHDAVNGEREQDDDGTDDERAIAVAGARVGHGHGAVSPVSRGVSPEPRPRCGVPATRRRPHAEISLLRCRLAARHAVLGWRAPDAAPRRTLDRRGRSGAI